MTGLILKDLLNLKRHSRMYLILIAFYIVLGVVNGDFVMFGSMITVLAAIMPITSIAYDEKNNWDRYALTMPVSRMNLVLSRYASGLIFLTASFVITILSMATIGKTPLIEAVAFGSGIFAVGIIFMDIVLPIIFKYGVEKGRIFMMLVLFAPTGALVLISKLGFAFPEEPPINLIYLLPLITAATSAASVYASIVIYGKKEF
ncbi:MAG TPA: ABC-2 transporter permease [Clostridiales bacterium]|nr:ABC-2 transporter permease [Clostridiales bacterium]